MKPLRVEYDPAVDAVAIDFPGFGPSTSARTVRLDRNRVLDYDEDAVYESVVTLAARDGVSLEQAAADLVQEGIKARARQEAKALLAEMRERSTDAPSDDQAMMIAVEEQKAMRAERRASGRS
jgi:hypothetical protein